MNRLKLEDILLVGFIGLSIGYGYELSNNIKLENETKEMIYYINEQNQEIEDLLDELQDKDYRIKQLKDLNELLDDLSMVPDNRQDIVLSLCYTESNLNYDVKHYGKYDKETIGICGIKEYWSDVIELDDVNSLYAGHLVLDNLLTRNDNNLEKALKAYKGAKKNMKPVDKVIKIYEQIKGYSI